MCYTTLQLCYVPGASQSSCWLSGSIPDQCPVPTCPKPWYKFPCYWHPSECIHTILGVPLDGGRKFRIMEWRESQRSEAFYQIRGSDVVFSNSRFPLAAINTIKTRAGSRSFSLEACSNPAGVPCQPLLNSAPLCFTPLRSEQFEEQNITSRFLVHVHNRIHMHCCIVHNSPRMYCTTVYVPTPPQFSTLLVPQHVLFLSLNPPRDNYNLNWPLSDISVHYLSLCYTFSYTPTSAGTCLQCQLFSLPSRPISFAWLSDLSLDLQLSLGR